MGIGPADPARNPFLVARLPVLERLLGGVPTLEAPRLAREGVAFPLDATLDTPGIPQSGTGQAALLTGENSARAFGRHFGPWTPVALRPIVEERSVLARTVEAGRRAAFANAYPRGWPGERSRRRVAAPPLAARAAGLLTRHQEALAAGEAVSSEIVNRGWREHLGHDVPEVTPAAAGRTLARVARDHDLTLYAHYATDTAGHRGGMAGAVAALERVDAFLGGVVEGLAGAVTLLVTSDHGNVEDVTSGHTRNPALGLAVGPGAEDLADRLRSILDVAPALLGPGEAEAADRGAPEARPD